MRRRAATTPLGRRAWRLWAFERAFRALWIRRAGTYEDCLREAHARADAFIAAGATGRATRRLTA